MINGSITALVTPFKDGGVDEKAFGDFIEWQIESGTHGLVPCGTTGETPTLTDKEHRRVIELCVEAANGRVPVIAGAGSNETRVSIAYAKKAKDVGADAALVVTPYYNKPSQEGIFQHYMHIARYTPVPIIIYNVPGRTSSYIEPETVIRLANASSKFVAVKDASGKMQDGSQIAAEKPDHFLLLSGDDPTTLSLMANGAEGVISVIANAFPKPFSDMIRAANNGNFQQARVLHHNLLYLHKWLYIEGNPAGIKAALEILELCGREVRLPLVPMTDTNFACLKKEMDRIMVSATPNH